MFNGTLNKKEKYKIVHTNLQKDQNNYNIINHQDYRKTLINPYEYRPNRPRSEIVNNQKDPTLNRSISSKPRNIHTHILNKDLNNIKNRAGSIGGTIGRSNNLGALNNLNVNVFKANNTRAVKPGQLDRMIDPKITYLRNNNSGNNIQRQATLPQKPKKNNLVLKKKNYFSNDDIYAVDISVDRENGLYNPSAKCVKEYSYREEMNIEYRQTMEDVCRIVDKFMNDNNKGLFCLYDGHGGVEPAKYVRDRMPEMFSRFLFETNFNIEKSFIFSFQKMDDELKLLSQCDNVGTTACLVYFYRESDLLLGTKRYMICANVGDTRCVLVTTKEARRISHDHKASEESEATRIKKLGGVVFNGRVFGQLALSRALGDHEMKKFGVTCMPSIHKHTITDKDKYVVICSDGVWDVLTESDIYKLSLKSNNSDSLASLIVKQAIANGSRDNISCVAIKVN
jgi:serine/threonine protein phosphatase PrpC